MKNQILKSYAKINLFLNVAKKSKNESLHNIQSLVFLINIIDKIFIRKSKEKRDKIKISGKFRKHVNKFDNSIINSLRVLRNTGIIKKKEKYEIILKKNIPVFSGLGGGTSNAGTIINFFLKKKKISKNKIKYFSKYVGSDLGLFLRSKRILQKNLFSTEAYKKKYLFYFIVVYPFLKSSTKEIYSKLDKFDSIKNKNYVLNYSRLELVKMLKMEKNSLENVVISKFPIIRKILLNLRFTKNCQFSRITGSGSACFGLYLNKRDASLALKQIKKKFPDFWCVISKTI